MTKFKFRGTGETYSSVPAGPVLGLLAAAAVIAWLLTVLWVLALVTAAVLASVVVLVALVRRAGSGEEGSRRLSHAAAALRDEVDAREGRQVTAVQPQAITNNFYGGTHLHLSPGTDAAEIMRRRPLIEGALIEED